MSEAMETPSGDIASADRTRNFLIAAAASAGFFGVALGAFGAHGLQPLLEQRGTMGIWQTAVHYWFYHTLALLVLGLGSGLPGPVKRRVALFWLAGMVVFSGSLFFLATTGPRWLGAVTPVGGILFLVGWVLLLPGLWQKPRLKK